MEIFLKYKCILNILKAHLVKSILLYTAEKVVQSRFLINNSRIVNLDEGIKYKYVCLVT